MTTTARQRFLNYVRDPASSTPIVSPFLPHPAVIDATLASTRLPVTDDPVANEIRLAQHLGYEPMFMTECSGLIFNWRIDESRSDGVDVVRIIDTERGEWVRRSPRVEMPWSDESGCPVNTPHDHTMLVSACDQIDDRNDELRMYPIRHGLDTRSVHRRSSTSGLTIAKYTCAAWRPCFVLP
jgi:hypothetical protein